MTEPTPPSQESQIAPELMKQQLSLTRLRQAIKPHGTLSRIDEKGRIDIGGAPLESAILYWSHRRIELEVHEWLDDDGDSSCDAAWQLLEDQLFNLPMWEKKGWSIEAYGPDDPPEDGQVSVWGSAKYWAEDERDLAEALRWLLDESLRVDTSNLIETAENRIRLEALGWRDWEIERMSVWRQEYLVKHQVRGELFTLDRSGKIRPREGCNVWMLRVPN